MSQHYSIYGYGTDHAFLIVSGNIQPVNVPVNLTVDFSFNYDNLVVEQPSGISPSLSEVSQHPVLSQLVVTLPPSTSSFNFTLIGSFQGTSLFYREAATIPVTSVTIGAPPFVPDSFVLEVQLTPQTLVVSTYPGPAQGALTQTVSLGDATYLVTNFARGFRGVLVLYQPAYRDWFLALYIAIIAVFVVISVPLARRLRRSAGPSIRSRLGSIPKAIAWFDYKKLLALLVGTSILMIGLALAFGPSPTPKVYLAATPTTSLSLGPVINASGYSYLTPNQASDEFDTLSTLGMFHVVVIADYPPPINSGGLGAADNIIAISGSSGAPQSYINLLSALYPSTLTVVNGPSELGRALAAQSLTYTGNNIGLTVSPSVYEFVTVLEALLSLLIPFFALAFFARYLVESTGKGLIGVAMAIGFAVFIFVFGELVLSQTAVLLGIPLALHASISPLETAGGALGLGGGTRPREVMGILGLIFGIVAGSGGRLKADRIGIIAFLGLVLFLLTDPLMIGQIFYSLSLFTLTSVGATSVGVQANNSVEGFMNLFMNLFGAFKSQSFFSQHGTVLFFAGAIPLAIYNRLHKTTATFLALSCAFVAGLGYVRIANQDLDIFKVLASVTPGVAIGLLAIAAFLGLNVVEGYLRKRVVVQ